MPWTPKLKKCIADAYFRQNSKHAAQLQIKERLRCEFPAHSIIYRWVIKFETYGTVSNLNFEDVDRPLHSEQLNLSRYLCS